MAALKKNLISSLLSQSSSRQQKQNHPFQMLYKTRFLDSYNYTHYSVPLAKQKNSNSFNTLEKIAFRKKDISINFACLLKHWTVPV
jgi:hypothetical protein